MSGKPVKDELGDRFLPSITDPVIHGTAETPETEKEIPEATPQPEPTE
jgi:hypothetical protein